MPEWIFAMMILLAGATAALLFAHSAGEPITDEIDDDDTAEPVAEEPTDSELQETETQEEPAQISDEEVAAVIAAVVAMLGGDEDIQIKSVTRKPKAEKPRWALEGIRQNTTPF